MSEHPVGWAATKLGEVTSVGTGATPKKSEARYYVDGTIPWVTSGAVNSERICEADAYITEEALRETNCRTYPSGTLLVAMYGEGKTRGKVAELQISAATNQALAAVQMKSKEIDRNYIRFLLTSKYLEIRSDAAGGVQPNLNLDLVRDIDVPLAPAAEQRRIASKLDSLRARSARARQELDHVPKMIERYKQAILRAACKGVLTVDWRTNNPDTESVQSLLKRVPSPDQPRGGREATDTVKAGMAGLSVNHPESASPERWEWTPLLRVARQETGHTPSRTKSSYWDGGIPWIGIKDANAHHGKIITETIQTISEKGLENSSARLLPEGTVCLSRTASVGYVTIMGRPMATSQDFATWTCTPALLPKFLMYALMAEGDDIREFGEGSTHTTIYFPEIRALHICLAPLEEQAEIIRRVEIAWAWIDKIATEHARAEHLLPKLDQAILAKAFRGELVPQDPNDEPASVLLERIGKQNKTPSNRKKSRTKTD